MQHDLTHAEQLAFPLFVLAMWVFRSVVAALLPLPASFVVTAEKRPTRSESCCRHTESPVCLRRQPGGARDPRKL